MILRRLVIAIVIVAASVPARADVRPEDVRQSIKSAIGWLKRAQRRDGSWPYVDDRFNIGADSLATLALLNAGVPTDDPVIASVLPRIVESQDQYTYNIALKIAVLAQADATRHRAAIESAARRLARMQLAVSFRRMAGNRKSSAAAAPGRPSALLDAGHEYASKAGTRVIYCGDNLDPLRSPRRPRRLHRPDLHRPARPFSRPAAG